MSPFDWALLPLRRYADFSGRSPRAEYWWFVLFQWLAIIALIIVLIASIAGSADPDSPPGAVFWVSLAIIGLVFVALFLPNLAVQVRRLHDQDLSGWLVLLFFIPYLGGIISIIFMCIAGTRGPNRFGPDPYFDERLEDVFA